MSNIALALLGAGGLARPYGHGSMLPIVITPSHDMGPRPCVGTATGHVVYRDVRREICDPEELLAHSERAEKAEAFQEKRNRKKQENNRRTALGKLKAGVKLTDAEAEALREDGQD